MRLSVTGDLATCPLAAKWEDALRSLVIRHPDPRSIVELEIIVGHPTSLCFRLDVGFCTVDPAREIRPFIISTVNLTYFPGALVAQRWVAAAWTGYLMHEALELVRVHGERPIDPHGGDLAIDKCLRHGLPVQLTAETLARTLALVVEPAAVTAMLEAV